MVQSLTLNLCQSYVPALHFQLLGDVFENPRYAALLVRVGDHAQCASIRQVPPMFLRLCGTVYFQQSVAPFRPVRLLCKKTFGTKQIKQASIIRFSLKRTFFKAPQTGECLIMEREVALFIKNGDRRSQLVHRLSVAFKSALQLILNGFDFAHIHRHARRSADIGNLMDIH